MLLFFHCEPIAVCRDDRDHPEFSLVVGDGENDTQQTLQHAFDQATAKPTEEGGGEGGGDRQDGRTRDPGLSLLQDSVLGIHPNGKEHSVYFVLQNIDLSSPSMPSLPSHVCHSHVTSPPPFPNLMNIPTHPCQPPAFQNAELDSLSMTSLGPGEFPSITNFDRSGSALPRFPLEANQPMPTIQEEVCDFSPCL